VSPLVAVLVVTLLFVVACALALPILLREPGAARVPGRPLRSNPAAWAVGVGLVMLAGAFLFPRLFGFAFVFLPFVWMRRTGRREREQRPPEG
jgi:hypothetical protein